jgi:hypothetical protein
MTAVNSDRKHAMRVRWATPTQYLSFAHPHLLSTSPPPPAAAAAAAAADLSSPVTSSSSTGPGAVARGAALMRESERATGLRERERERESPVAGGATGIRRTLRQMARGMSEDASGDALPYNDKLDVAGAATMGQALSY